MTVLSITTLELHKRILERGGRLERHGAKHDVYKGPLGTFTVPNGKRKPVTGAIVRSAARGLGTTIQDLLGT
jgi:hypothetical protein